MRSTNLHEQKEILLGRSCVRDRVLRLRRVTLLKQKRRRKILPRRLIPAANAGVRLVVMASRIARLALSQAPEVRVETHESGATLEKGLSTRLLSQPVQ